MNLVLSVETTNQAVGSSNLSGRANVFVIMKLGAFLGRNTLRRTPFNATPHIDKSRGYARFDHMVKNQVVEMRIFQCQS